MYSVFMVEIKGSLKSQCKSKARSKFRKKLLICYNFSTPVVTRIYNCKWMNKQMTIEAKSRTTSGKQHLKSVDLVGRKRSREPRVYTSRCNNEDLIRRSVAHVEDRSHFKGIVECLSRVRWRQDNTYTSATSSKAECQRMVQFYKQPSSNLHTKTNKSPASLSTGVQKYK